MPSRPLPHRSVDQNAVDVAARKLADLGYDVGDGHVVEGVGTTTNLRMATGLAIMAYLEASDHREFDRARAAAISEVIQWLREEEEGYAALEGITRAAEVRFGVQ